MTEERRDPCSRGCTNARRHIEECEDWDTCHGCAPRPATHGLLCESCHADLMLVLTDAPRQVAELAASVEPSMQWSLTAQPASGKVGPRLTSGGPDYITAARSRMTPGEVEAIRIACLDVARELEDVLSEVVEMVASSWGCEGPAQLRTTDGDMRRKVWRPVWPDGSPRTDHAVLVTYRGDDGSVEQGQYEWTEPPARFAVDTACRWLREQMLRVELTDGMGDTLETLRDVMSRAHSLAPWREPGRSLHGVPCPRCHRCSLVLYNSPPGKAGTPDALPQARCEAYMCRVVWPWDKIALWARVLESGETPSGTWTSERHGA